MLTSSSTATPRTSKCSPHSSIDDDGSLSRAARGKEEEELRSNDVVLKSAAAASPATTVAKEDCDNRAANSTANSSKVKKDNNRAKLAAAEALIDEACENAVAVGEHFPPNTGVERLIIDAYAEVKKKRDRDTCNLESIH